MTIDVNKLKYQFKINKESFEDRFEWFKVIPQLSFNKYGGVLYAHPFNDEYVVEIEYGFVPSCFLSREVTEDYNGFVNYYWVNVHAPNLSDGTTPSEETLTVYLDRLISYLTYNVRGDHKGTRDAYHEHAFNAITFWIKGRVQEQFVDGAEPIEWAPSFRPKYTPRSNFHRIKALETSWALCFRGPWKKTWKEKKGDALYTLTHGRNKVFTEEKD